MNTAEKVGPTEEVRTIGKDKSRLKELERQPTQGLVSKAHSLDKGSWGISLSKIRGTLTPNLSGVRKRVSRFTTSKAMETAYTQVWERTLA